MFFVQLKKEHTSEASGDLSRDNAKPTFAVPSLPKPLGLTRSQRSSSRTSVLSTGPGMIISEDP